ncbi:MAG: hypothetical protein IPL60_13665 [Ardenticatenia bacterium]|nr:hypothetical protein [Ardenticatenia bacterium]
MNRSLSRRSGGLLTVIAFTALVVAISVVLDPFDNASLEQGPGKATLALPVVISSAVLESVADGDVDIDQDEQGDPDDAAAGASEVVGRELYEIIGGNVVVFDITNPTAPVFRGRSSGIVFEDLFATSLGVFAAEGRTLTVTDPVSGATLEDERGTRLRRVWLAGSTLAMGEGADMVGIATAMTAQAGVLFIATTWESAVPNLGEDQAPSPMTGLLAAALDGSKALVIRELVRPSYIAAMASVGTSLYVLEEPSAEEAFAIGFPLTYRLRSLDSSFDPPRPGTAELEFTQGWGNETELMAAGDGRLVVAVDRLYAVGLNSPDDMRVEGSWEMSGPPTALALAGDEVVVATGFEEEASIERLALDPGGRWRELETITPSAALFSLARLDKHILATGNDGMSMWEVGGDGSSIQVAGPPLTRDWHVDVTANSHHAYALDYWAEVVILRRSGDDLERVGSAVIDGHRNETGVAIDADEDHVAIALSESVLVYRIVEPAELELVGEFTDPMGGPDGLYPQDISVSGNNVVVANGSQGVMILSLVDDSLTLQAEMAAPTEGRHGASAVNVVELDGLTLLDWGDSGWLRKTDISGPPVELDRLMVDANAAAMSLAEPTDRMILSTLEGAVMVVNVASTPMAIVDERSSDDLRSVEGMAYARGRIVTVSTFDPGIRMFAVDGAGIGDPVDVERVDWALACAALDGAILISRGNELLLIDVEDGRPVIVDDLDLAG